MYQHLYENEENYSSVFGVTETKRENGNTSFEFSGTGFWDNFSAGNELKVTLKDKYPEKLAKEMTKSDYIIVNTSCQKEWIEVEKGEKTVVVRKNVIPHLQMSLKEKFENVIQTELGVGFESCQIVSFYCFTREAFVGKAKLNEGRTLLFDEYEDIQDLYISHIVVKINGEKIELESTIRMDSF